ncbi:restriction endonuclease subunit S [Pseudomonas aeruginosa]
MVPDKWKTLPLSEVCDEKISYGIVQAGPHIEGGVPYIKSSDLNAEIDHATLQRTSKEIHKKYIRSAVHPGDIVFSLRGNIGACRIIPESIPIANLTQGTARISIKPGLSADFFKHQLTSQTLIKSILEKAKGSTFQEISLDSLRKLHILVPPPTEQKKIAKILSTWDQATTIAEQLLFSSQQQRKALMQQLLSGKQRLHGFSKEWRSVKLNQLFSRVTTKNTEANTNVVTISAQHGLIRQDDFFKKTVASEILDNYFLLHKGQFAYNKSYSNGYPMGAIKRLKLYEKGVVTTLYICFEVSDADKCCAKFFEHYFESGLLNKGLSKVANEGGRAHGLLNVKPSDFFSLTVFVPCVEEQQKIASVLDAADREVKTLQQQLASLKQEKRALMQQLLTGKRRVKVDAPETA